VLIDAKCQCAEKIREGKEARAIAEGPFQRDPRALKNAWSLGFGRNRSFCKFADWLLHHCAAAFRRASRSSAFMKDLSDRFRFFGLRRTELILCSVIIHCSPHRLQRSVIDVGDRR
jgi:hypothetical protein